MEPALFWNVIIVMEKRSDSVNMLKYLYETNRTDGDGDCRSVDVVPTPQLLRWDVDMVGSVPVKRDNPRWHPVARCLQSTLHHGHSPLSQRSSCPREKIWRSLRKVQLKDVFRGHPELLSFSRANTMLIMIHCIFIRGVAKVNIFKVLFWDWGRGSQKRVLQWRSQGGCERTSPNFCSSTFTKSTLHLHNAY